MGAAYLLGPHLVQQCLSVLQPVGFRQLGAKGPQVGQRDRSPQGVHVVIHMGRCGRDIHQALQNRGPWAVHAAAQSLPDQNRVNGLSGPEPGLDGLEYQPVLLLRKVRVPHPAQHLRHGIRVDQHGAQHAHLSV